MGSEGMARRKSVMNGKETTLCRVTQGRGRIIANRGIVADVSELLLMLL